MASAMASASSAAATDAPIYNSTITAPLTQITSTDHSGLIIIANAFGLIMVLIFLAIRVSVRLYLSPPFDKDDWLLFAATAVSIIYFSLIFELVSRGFGMAIDDIDVSNLIPMQETAYASDFFYLITLWCSKCSMATVFMRLSPDQTLVRVAKGVLVASTVWLVTSMLVIALRCDLSHPWNFVDANCTDVVLRWQIISAFDIAIELALFGMAILLIKDLKMRLRRKAYVVMAFALRLPIIAAIVLRLHYQNVETYSDDPTFTGVCFVIWSIVEVAFGICSGNIACLKPFIAAFNTCYGGSVEINALRRGSGKGSYMGDSRTINSITHPERTKAARRKQREIEAASGASVTLHSATADDFLYDMDHSLEAGGKQPVRGVRSPPATKTYQPSKQSTGAGEREPYDPLANVSIGATNFQNAEISHGDADSTQSYNSRQKLVHREMG